MRRLLNNRWVRLAVGLAVSLALLYLAFSATTFAAVWATLRQADLWWVGAALLSVAANNLFKAWRWQVMLGPPGKSVPFLDLLMAHLSGQMLNTLFPVRIGDLSRAYVIGGEGPGRVFVFGTVMLEKIIDLLWFAFLFLLLIALIPLPGWVKDSGWVLVGAAALAGGVTFAMAAQRQRFMLVIESISKLLPGKWQAFVVSRLHNGLDCLDVLQQRWDLVKIAGWSTLIWVTAALTNSLTMLALDIHLDLSASLLVLVGLIVGVNVAAVPGRIGVFEWICVLVLAAYGIGQTQALSYGLLLHAIVYAPTTLLGVVSFFLLSRRRTPLQSVPVDDHPWSGGDPSAAPPQRKISDTEGVGKIGLMDGND